MSKQPYFIPEASGNPAAFNAEWQPVEKRLKALLPLTDVNGAVVTRETTILDIDFTKVAGCLTGEPDNQGLADRFLAEVRKKNPGMTVASLLSKQAGELTRWRKMGNRVVLMPNALVLHINSL